MISHESEEEWFEFKENWYEPVELGQYISAMSNAAVMRCDAIAYTLKMSYKSDYKIEGFFEYVVPPLEGFWWQDGVDGCDYSSKVEFNWISVIRHPICKKEMVGDSSY